MGKVGVYGSIKRSPDSARSSKSWPGGKTDSELELWLAIAEKNVAIRKHPPAIAVKKKKNGRKNTSSDISNGEEVT